MLISLCTLRLIRPAPSAQVSKSLLIQLQSTGPLTVVHFLLAVFYRLPLTLKKWSTVPAGRFLYIALLYTLQSVYTAYMPGLPVCAL
jgi:hypothetical protein